MTAHGTHHTHGTPSNGHTLLDRVAEHEQGLMAQIESARAEAARLIDSAHGAALAHLQHEQQQLDLHLTELRRKAAELRESEAVRMKQETIQKVENIRRETGQKLDAVRQEALARIVPQLPNQQSTVQTQGFSQ